MMKIDEIWQELECDFTSSKGLLFRRYSGSFIPQLFIALKNPERQRCIAAVINQSVKVDISSFSKLSDITVEIQSNIENPEKKIVLISLITKEFSDIFTILCEDLIISISPIDSESTLLKELFNRLEKWIALFEKATQGLSPESQRGLFGELFFLNKLLINDTEFNTCLLSWGGPEKQIRDFQFGNWSVEVKTTLGNHHEKIHISNERQLDPSNIDYLILYHISLEERVKGEVTLNKLVEQVTDFLKNDIVSLLRFKSKLLDAGYFDKHKELYNDIGYIIRHEAFYSVEGTFPRIEEKDIREGVGDVKYSIIVSRCQDYIITENEIFEIIKGND